MIEEQLTTGEPSLEMLAMRQRLAEMEAAESQRKVVAERRPSPTAVAKVHPISASFQLTALPASTDLSKSREFLSRTEAEWLLGVAA